MNDGGGLIGSLLGLGIIGAILAVVLIIFVGLVIVFGLPQHTCAQKLGHSKPWMAFLPIAHVVQLFNLADLSGWLVLLGFVPVIGWIAIVLLAIYSWMKIAEKIGHPGWLAILMIIPILGIVIPFYIAYGTPTEAQRY